MNTTAATIRTLAGYYEQAVERHRIRLAGTAPTGNLEELVGIVNDLAEAEGAFDACTRAISIIDYVEREYVDNVAGTTTARITTWALEALTMGARDTWSGRGNDARRARHDGTAEAITRIMGSIR